MTPRLLFLGWAVWAAGTIVLRAAGHHLFPPSGSAGTVGLYAASLVGSGAFVAVLCRSLSLPADRWPTAAAIVVLPTLLLDAWTSAFFPVVFPNLPAQSAGLFAGWMLSCCAGALAAALLRARA